MVRKLTFSLVVVAALACGGRGQAQTDAAQTPVQQASYGQGYAAAPYTQAPRAMAYGRAWGGGNRDCSRFYHYPYVFYPQNFRGNEYFRSSDSMYYRYPPEMQIPVYNRQWHNYYPSDRRFHWGHHFILDVF